jgi:hypothetical protein
MLTFSLEKSERLEVENFFAPFFSLEKVGKQNINNIVLVVT